VVCKVCLDIDLLIILPVWEFCQLLKSSCRTTIASLATDTSFKGEWLVYLSDMNAIKFEDW
jgi:hypothetical protein